jgi:NAD(P)H-dependent FMN reductase
MIHALNVIVIIGSVRRRRICPLVAAWVAEVGRDLGPWGLELVDLRDWSLPMDDEPEMPHGGFYANAHTQAWSAKVAAADAVVFVTPQYNWGYPAALKNALDHLYREWAGKPGLIVTYGGHGGGKCAAQLREVLDGLKMIPVPTMPGLVLARARIEANAGHVEPAVEFAQHRPALEQAFTELAAALRPSP